MREKVIIETEKCIGCGTCIDMCPDIFAFDESEEKAEVILPEGGAEECIEDAIFSCPVGCIHWEE
ncbi:MAG: ferredoxin [Desulfobacterales bacterium]|nr:ferredoxin [Desulfobacterales bacterium]MDD4071764.1 ferredoxin [Desulfobacterales bacterium]MDD4391974.1 ferredoxin [Desulfobacterales bacterium]